MSESKIKIISAHAYLGEEEATLVVCVPNKESPHAVPDADLLSYAVENTYRIGKEVKAWRIDARRPCGCPAEREFYRQTHSHVILRGEIAE